MNMKILVKGYINAKGFVLIDSELGGNIAARLDTQNVNEEDYDVVIYGDMNIDSMLVKRGQVDAIDIFAMKTTKEE